MWDFLSGNPRILVLVTTLVIVVLFALVILIRMVVSNGGSFKISRDGFEVSNSKRGTIFNGHSNAKVFETCADVASRVSKLVEEEVDSIHGIKNRCYQQSIEYAESTVNALAYKVIESYKKKYIEKYGGSEANLRECPTKTQIDNLSDPSKEKYPCEKLNCPVGCNSGVYYFECRFIKDIRIISQRLENIIRENHLINRGEREYEEEVTSLAESCVYEVFSRVVSYTIPVDNKLAIETVEEFRHDFLSDIADSLRRSRTLSQRKRDDIKDQKDKTNKCIQEALQSVLSLISPSAQVKVTRGLRKDDAQ